MSESPRHKDVDAEAIITPYLKDGETLRWAGRPARFPVPKLSVRIVLVIMFFVFLDIVIEPINGLLMFIIVPVLVVVLLYSFLLARQVYGITDRRIIICNRAFLGQTYNLPFIPHMWKYHIEYKHSKKTGIGTIWLFDHPSAWRNYNFIRPIFVPQYSWLYKGGIYEGATSQALFNINDSAYVESLLPRWHCLD